MNATEGERNRESRTAAPQGEQSTGEVESRFREDLPEDVAVLFRWAGVHGMPYREFRASQQVETEDEAQSAVAAEAVPAELAVAAEIAAALPVNESPAPQQEATMAAEEMQPVRLPQRRVASFWPQGMRDVAPAGEKIALSNSYGDASGKASGTADQVAVHGTADRDDSAVVANYATTPQSRSAAVTGQGVESFPARDEAGRTRPYAHKNAVEAAEPAKVSAPSWLAQYTAHLRAGEEAAAPRTETLQTARERVASRWFALRNLLEVPGADLEAEPAEEKPPMPPLLAIYSVAGGTGRTSLAASLARALAAQGERILLVELTGHEVLPFFFGAQGERGGQERVFAPPPGTSFAPIHLRRYALATPEEPGREEAPWIDLLLEHSRGFSRVLVDVPTAATGALRQMLGQRGQALVPLLPDMNSALSLRAVRRVFAGAPSEAAPPSYLLTQFDPAERLHLDLREVLRQELGEALLPMAVRRSQLVTEALAQGMTVMDYAADAPVTGDLREVAVWVRSLQAPHEDGIGQARWIER